MTKTEKLKADLEYLTGDHPLEEKLALTPWAGETHKFLRGLNSVAVDGEEMNACLQGAAARRYARAIADSGIPLLQHNPDYACALVVALCTVLLNMTKAKEELAFGEGGLVDLGVLIGSLATQEKMKATREEIAALLARP